MRLTGLRRLAVGDLTIRLDMPFPEEYEGLRADFNHSLTILEDVLGMIGGGAHGLQMTCSATRDGMAETAEAGGRLTAAIAKTAADVGTLAETLKVRKMQAQHTADIAHNARLDMRPSKEMMQAATVAMEAIRKASLKIEPATATIRDIAFQANMLALNAGIEAAHSGEAENDFKTVAKEILGLAERAAEAAKEISGLSRRSAEAAELGGRSVEKAGGELDAMTIYADALQGHVEALATRLRKGDRSGRSRPDHNDDARQGQPRPGRRNGCADDEDRPHEPRHRCDGASRRTFRAGHDPAPGWSDGAAEPQTRKARLAPAADQVVMSEGASDVILSGLLCRRSFSVPGGVVFLDMAA